jgi:hypothetical protein
VCGCVCLLRHESGRMCVMAAGVVVGKAPNEDPVMQRAALSTTGDPPPTHAHTHARAHTHTHTRASGRAFPSASWSAASANGCWALLTSCTGASWGKRTPSTRWRPPCSAAGACRCWACVSVCVAVCVRVYSCLCATYTHSVLLCVCACVCVCVRVCVCLPVCMLLDVSVCVC